MVCLVVGLGFGLLAHRQVGLGRAVWRDTRLGCCLWVSLTFLPAAARQQVLFSCVLGCCLLQVGGQDKIVWKFFDLATWHGHSVLTKVELIGSFRSSVCAPIASGRHFGVREVNTHLLHWFGVSPVK